MANVNYDPVKAHEYYEKHKQLKGRRSTKGWNDTQKEQWAYAKEQLSNEHKANNKAIAEGAKAKREQLENQAKEKIAQIRERIMAKKDNMTKDERASMKALLSEKIDSIRASLKASKGDVSASAKSAREKEKTSYKQKLDSAHKTISGG